MSTNQEIMTLILIGTVSMLLMAIGVIFFIVIYQRRLLGQQEKIQEIEKNYQQDLLSASIESQEQTSQRIAKELHDSVGSNLSAIKLYALRILQKSKEKKPTTNLTQQVSHLVDETIQNVRDISRNLLPAILEKFGLVEAIQELSDKINQTQTIQIHFEANEDASRWESKKELALYRIVQELITNTLRHAQAQNIDINLYMSPKNLKLIYQDDGKGLDISSKSQLKKGLGLRNIESRVQVLKGTIHYESDKKDDNKGLQVRIHIKL